MSLSSGKYMFWIEKRERAINSVYPVDLVDNILQHADTLERNLVSAPKSDKYEICFVQWFFVLSGTLYESRIEKFASRINQTLRHHKIKLIVKSTGFSIGQFLS